MMPLFIFVTGKFAKQSKKEPKTKALKIFKIFIIAQVLITIYYGFFLHIINPFKNILTPRFTLWYLLTCAFLYLSEYILRKVEFKKIFIISLFLALFSGFIPQITNFLSLTRTIAVLPFFILGYYSSTNNYLTFINKHKKIITFLVCISVIWFLFNQNFFLFKDTYLKYNYYAYRSPIVCFYKRCIIYVLFFIFTSFMLNIMPNKKTILSNLGTQTLSIYLLHGVLLKTIKYFKLFLNNEIIGTVLIYVSVILISIIISNIYKKIKGVFYEHIRITKREI
jgi:fucose 4-O-acetylase-like acetyltransferase